MAEQVPDFGPDSLKAEIQILYEKIDRLHELGERKWWYGFIAGIICGVIGLFLGFAISIFH